MWHNALNQDFDALDPCLHGWGKDETSKSLYPVMLPPETKIAPDEVLRSITCGCKSNSCVTNACGCKKK